MTDATFLAIDWGTTNRRIYRIENGKAAFTERDSCGIVAVPAGGFDREIDALRDRHGDVPMVLAGMVGSNRGWIDAGYVAAPASLETLAAHVVRPRLGIVIVPGVQQIAEGRGDVMRGEEVQFLGAVAEGFVPADAMLCQPGTHCKWARMQGGMLADFTTTMTGELFSLLKAHALIGAEMTHDVADNPAFADGIAESARGDLLASLFAVRASALLGLRARADAASFVSGLLIGFDVRARIAADGHVFLLADPQLGALYARGIITVGGTVDLIDSHTAFVAGIVRLQELLT